MNTSRIILLTLISFFSFVNANAQCYNLVWADEFSGTDLDLTQWTHQVGGGGWGNNELQYYRPENTEVTGGKLKIIAKQESYNGSNYTSSRIITRDKGDFRYGRIEMYAKLPETQGLWPAFWMMPTEEVYGGWPNSGEIDIMEMLGHQPSITYGTIHTAPPAGQGGSANSSSWYALPTGSFASGFHTFAIEWEPAVIRWYVDGTLFATKTPANLSPWRFTELFHIILNVAVGGNWPGPPNGSSIFPQTMEVDYVRVYQKNEELSIVGNSKVVPFETASYRLPDISGATYNWTVPSGASIASGQGTPEISVAFGTTGGNITCSTTTSCGTISPSKMVEVTPNVANNPSFENDFQFWNTNLQNGSNAYASMAISTLTPQHLLKKACVTTNQLPPNSWNIQLSQPNIDLVAGQSYTLKFWAQANAANKTISAAVINATTYSPFKYQTFNVGTAWQEFTFSFTPGSSATALLNFDCGHSIATVCFDNVTFGLTSLLPVELLSFDADIQDQNNALVTWSTENEPNIAQYELERSSTGIDFATVFVKEISNQNSAQKSDYQYLDKDLKRGIHYYRLKSVEENGRIDYSRLVSVVVKDGSMVTIFPNPTKGNLTITQNATNFEPYTAYLHNSLGQQVWSQTLENTTTLLNLAGFPAGIYALQLGEEWFKVVLEN